MREQRGLTTAGLEGKCAEYPPQRGRRVLGIPRIPSIGGKQLPRDILVQTEEATYEIYEMKRIQREGNLPCAGTESPRRSFEPSSTTLDHQKYICEKMPHARSPWHLLMTSVSDGRSPERQSTPLSLTASTSMAITVRMGPANMFATTTCTEDHFVHQTKPVTAFLVIETKYEHRTNHR